MSCLRVQKYTKMEWQSNHQTTFGVECRLECIVECILLLHYRAGRLHTVAVQITQSGRLVHSKAMIQYSCLHSTGYHISKRNQESGGQTGADIWDTCELYQIPLPISQPLCVYTVHDILTITENLPLKMYSTYTSLTASYSCTINMQYTELHYIH